LDRPDCRPQRLRQQTGFDLLQHANVAIARELAGWCWSLAVMDDRPSPRSASSRGRWWQRVDRPATHL
jgi:hypothetical protein